jgi:hypothetical protein
MTLEISPSVKLHESYLVPSVVLLGSKGFLKSGTGSGSNVYQHTIQAQGTRSYIQSIPFESNNIVITNSFGSSVSPGHSQTIIFSVIFTFSQVQKGTVDMTSSELFHSNKFYESGTLDSIVLCDSNHIVNSIAGRVSNIHEHTNGFELSKSYFETIQPDSNRFDLSNDFALSAGLVISHAIRNSVTLGSSEVYHDTKDFLKSESLKDSLLRQSREFRLSGTPERSSDFGGSFPIRGSVDFKRSDVGDSTTEIDGTRRIAESFPPVSGDFEQSRNYGQSNEARQSLNSADSGSEDQTSRFGVTNTQQSSVIYYSLIPDTSLSFSDSGIFEISSSIEKTDAIKNTNQNDDTSKVGESVLGESDPFRGTNVLIGTFGQNSGMFHNSKWEDESARYSVSGQDQASQNAKCSVFDQDSTEFGESREISYSKHISETNHIARTDLSICSTVVHPTGVIFWSNSLLASIEIVLWHSFTRQASSLFFESINVEETTRIERSVRISGSTEIEASGPMISHRAVFAESAVFGGSSSYVYSGREVYSMIQDKSEHLFCSDDLAKSSLYNSAMKVRDSFDAAGTRDFESSEWFNGTHERYISETIELSNLLRKSKRFVESNVYIHSFSFNGTSDIWVNSESGINAAGVTAVSGNILIIAVVIALIVLFLIAGIVIVLLVRQRRMEQNKNPNYDVETEFQEEHVHDVNDQTEDVPSLFDESGDDLGGLNGYNEFGFGDNHSIFDLNENETQF